MARVPSKFIRVAASVACAAGLGIGAVASAPAAGAATNVTYSMPCYQANGQVLANDTVTITDWGYQRKAHWSGPALFAVSGATWVSGAHHTSATSGADVLWSSNYDGTTNAYGAVLLGGQPVSCRTLTLLVRAGSGANTLIWQYYPWPN
jgi:hypothetical protein